MSSKKHYSFINSVNWEQIFVNFYNSEMEKYATIKIEMGDDCGFDKLESHTHLFIYE